MYSCTQHPALMYPSIHTAMDPGIRESMRQGTRIVYVAPAWWLRFLGCPPWLRGFGDNLSPNRFYKKLCNHASHLKGLASLARGTVLFGSYYRVEVAVIRYRMQGGSLRGCGTVNNAGRLPLQCSNAFMHPSSYTSLYILLSCTALLYQCICTKYMSTRTTYDILELVQYCTLKLCNVQVITVR